MIERYGQACARASSGLAITATSVAKNKKIRFAVLIISDPFSVIEEIPQERSLS
jgi:hypothetical protein